MSDTSTPKKRLVGFEEGPDGVLRGIGCRPPIGPMPPRPKRINFTDEEIEERLRRRNERLGLLLGRKELSA